MKWFDIYNDVSEEEATRLLLAAGKAELRKMEPFAGGWANSTYLLTLDNDTQLVLKVWTNKTPTAVERIILNTCWLVDHGVFTSLPLQLKDGERMFIINGLSWTLMPYISGDWLSADPSSLQDIGRVQALLHQVPVFEDIPHSLSYGYVFWERLVEVARKQEAPAPFIQNLKKETTTLKLKIPEDLPRGIIHGDLSPVM
jgi:Ser/Thr protein kinase RdoA (MazF antagonist)